MGAKCSSCIKVPKCISKYCACCSCCKFHCGQQYDVTGSQTSVRMNPLTLVAVSVDEADSTSSEILSIFGADLCIDHNGPLHHTERFDLMQKNSERGSQLVIRRGQPFKIRLSLNRPYSRTNDAISFVFTLNNDEKPSQGHGTLIGTSLRQSSFELGDSHEWGCAIDTVNGKTLDILIKPAVTAAIGEWRVEVDSQVMGVSGIRSYKYPSTFYVLFNPWCPDDQCYFPDDEALDEYVLADTTLIWRGSYNRMRPSVWKLGQFEKDVLDCSLLLVSAVGKVAPTFRGDPVRIARALSAAVNSPDDDGAVLGNWTEDFAGGTAPTKWVGSVAIMQQYYKKRSPVKYGQCWTFGGVLSTVARAIGLPSRIITCYASAHDTQASLTVDYFVNEDGQVMEELNSDSIWNYHVWNEVWMERPDLGAGYGGWQAIDATPQEMSDAMYRCGPASVRAVKLGEILRPYDCNFLYSEVNADKVFWRYSGPYQPLKLLRKDTLGIGQLISTKKVGKWERDDVTSTYKFAERSQDERDTMVKALRQVNNAFSRFYLNEDFNDVYFNFELLDDIKIGETFSVILHIKNRSNDTTYQINGSLHVESILYTGKQRENVKSHQFTKELVANTKEIIKMEVTYTEYFKKLLDQGAFNISCMAAVENTDYDYFAQDDFRVRKPDIKITFQGEPISQQEIDVIVRLTNPLPVPLKKGLFQLEGPGIENQIQMKIAEVPVGGTTSATFKYIPPYAGRAALVCKFNSKELDDVDGFFAYEVQPRPEDVIIDNNTIMSSSNGHYIERTDVIP